MIQVDQYGEFLECSCGNDVMASGFDPVDTNGEVVEPTQEAWVGKLWKCGRCGVVEEVAR